MGHLADLIDAEFGVETRSRITTPNVLVANDIALIPENADRLAFIAVNFSANEGYMLPTPAVTAAFGIPVPANGGSTALHWREDFHMVGYPWRAQQSVANAVWLVVEVLGVGPRR